MFKQPMRTSFEDVNVAQWQSVGELLGFLAEMNLVEATFKSCEIPVPAHFDLKRQEITVAIKTMHRVEMLKEVLMLEQKVQNMRTEDEIRADLKSQIATLKGRLGVDQAPQISAKSAE